jgi:hypothetical protein
MREDHLEPHYGRLPTGEVRINLKDDGGINIMREISRSSLRHSKFICLEESG